MAFVRISSSAFSRASTGMAASVAASVINRGVVIPLGVTPEKTKAMKYLYPQGGEILRKNKRGRNILGGHVFRIMHVGHASPVKCVLFHARVYWLKVIYNKSAVRVDVSTARRFGLINPRKNA
jgi:hypothetical protein